MKDIKKILVPIDFTAHSEKIVESAALVAGKFEALLEVVFVVETLEGYAGFAVPHISLDNLEKDLINRAQNKMEDFINDFPHKNISFNGKVLYGKVAEQIVNHAEAEGCDLIVIGTQTCRGLEKMIFGSVTEKVIKSAACPVLTLNPCI
ncbi:MAG: universal stress protein [Desulfobulbaceae bacterium]|nr:universal stress protein [Desulfobulbaceae bacterium]HIJ78476.1 universal stress protein [Deltaproteobacteria bacterium]